MRGLAGQERRRRQLHVRSSAAALYDHYVPSPINHMVLRGEFLTAYTPYQPEAEPGHAADDLRVPDDDRRADRHGRGQRVHLRRRLVAGRGRADGPRDQRTATSWRSAGGVTPALSPRGRDLRATARAEAARRPVARRRAGPRRRPARGGRQDRGAGGPVAELLRLSRRRRRGGRAGPRAPARCSSWSAIR